MRLCNVSHENLRFATGGGRRDSSKALGFHDQDGVFGDANHFILDSCPCLRSVGLDVRDGLGFVWLPGQLPFYVKDCSKFKYSCDESNLVRANRVEENVPFFSRMFDLIPGMPGEVEEIEEDADDFVVGTPPELASEAVEVLD